MSLADLLTHVAADSPEAALGSRIDFERLPKHVAIIMDGNGRWAAQRHLPRVEGHRAGIDAVRDTVESSARLGIGVLTLYAFSVENWKRPETEVLALMGLLRQYLRLELKTLLKNNIRFKVIGQPERLSREVREELQAAEARTATNTGMQFNIALSYGGRAEIVDAAKRAIRDGVPADALDEEKFSSLLYTAGQPDPDLMIRTSGELRISNFMLWQTAYTEFVFSDCLWPEFGEAQLDEAIAAFRARDRRFGGVNVPGVPQEA